MSELLLKVDGISKSYFLKNGEEKLALNNISFELSKGECLGIIGANGSGKSTLLKILSNIIKPDKGQITLYGSTRSILDLGFDVIPELTGIENIMLNATIEGCNKNDTQHYIEQVIDFAEIGEYINEPVKNYSSGMFLRLAFSIKTCLPCDMLLLDEVIDVGDINFQYKVKNQINNLKHKGGSLILVSHSLKQVEQYCERVLLLDKGVVTDFGIAKNIIDKYYRTKMFNNNTCLGNNEYIEVISIGVANHENILTNGSVVEIELLFNKKIIFGIDINLQISNSSGVILGDSNLFRQHADRLDNITGNCFIKITIPSFIFNSGIFYGSIFFGNADMVYLKCEHAFYFVIEPDNWEKDMFWNDGRNSFPLRPKLDWQINTIN